MGASRVGKETGLTVNGEQQEALAYRKKYRGLIAVHGKVLLEDKSALDPVSAVGAAETCSKIHPDPLKSFDYRCRALPGNMNFPVTPRVAVEVSPAAIESGEAQVALDPPATEKHAKRWVCEGRRFPCEDIKIEQPDGD